MSTQNAIDVLGDASYYTGWLESAALVTLGLALHAGGLGALSLGLEGG